MKKSLVSFAETFIAGVVLSIVNIIFVAQSLEIVGDSMYPTLENKEKILVEKITYKTRPPQKNEVIIFKSPQNERIFLIKRVVAAQGEVIDISKISKKSVEPADLGKIKKYAKTPVPEGYLAVMGDNFSESYDSREFGLVPTNNVVGKAFMVYWPLTKIRSIK